MYYAYDMNESPLRQPESSESAQAPDQGQLAPAQTTIGLKRSKKPLFVASIVVLLVAAGVAGYFLKNNESTNKSVTNNPVVQSKEKLPGLILDESKNYGDKYKDGLLPVGDKNYSTTSAKKGTIYLCNANFVPEGQAGAQSRGPWFVGTDKWNIFKKAKVAGSIKWTPNITNQLVNGKRVITTNGLPEHTTGVFPVVANDPAYSYDRNPNKISAQSLSYELDASPTYGDAKCMGMESGIMLTGSPLNNGFDAGGRDAGAWEVQDACEGHPQNKGQYHYHTLSSCVTNASVKTVIGFALDGFPLTGPKIADGNYLTTSDLDECHGITSEIILDGKKVTQYHYVMTQDFPYSVSCFRGTAIQPPGLPENTGGQQAPSSRQSPPAQSGAQPQP